MSDNFKNEPGDPVSDDLNLGVGHAADDPFTPEFRTVQVDGHRKGFKLERLFWTLLDDLAGRRKTKRAELVAEILAGGESSDANATSRIRCYVAKDLAETHKEFETALKSVDVIKLLQTAPVPAFAINQHKNLLKVNAEFVQIVRVISGNMVGNPQTDAIQLTLDTPISQILEELAGPAEWTLCGYTISVEGRSRRGRAKIVTVPGLASGVLVGYLAS